MIFFILLAASNIFAAEALHYAKEDSIKFVSIIKKISAAPAPASDVGLLAAKIAGEFVGTPYAAYSLENEGEPLTIKLTGVDCTTLIEYTMGLLTCLVNKRHDFTFFCETIAKIRYRNGLRDGYASRLHYFTEWLYDNSSKRLLSIITDTIGNKRMAKAINFMSTHDNLYKGLKDSLTLSGVRATEKALSDRGFVYIEKGKAFDNRQGKISTGDIIAFVSTIEGLDVSHAVMAVRKMDKLYFLHASSKSGRVEQSKETLGSYLQRSSKLCGIIVGRINPDGLK